MGMLWLPAPRRQSGPAFDALSFDASGAAQFASVASNAALVGADADLSLAVRFRLDSNTGVNQFLAGKLDGSQASNQEYGLYYHNGFDRLLWQTNLDGGTLAQVGANNLGSPALSTWYVATCTHDAVNDRIRIWVNAAAVNSTAYASGIKTDVQPFRVGCDGNGTWKLDGAVDWVGLWQGRVLESAEHLLLVNGGATQRFPDLDAGLLTSLSAWWDFEEGASPTVDKQGASDLTWTGGPTPVTI